MSKILGESVLIRKPNQQTYYRNHTRLQEYVREMCNEVSNKYGGLCKERDNSIGERGLLVFVTTRRDREIKLNFPKTLIPPFSFDIGNYDETLDQQIHDWNDNNLE
jgi:hypothetical protein